MLFYICFIFNNCLHSKQTAGFNKSNCHNFGLLVPTWITQQTMSHQICNLPFYDPGSTDSKQSKITVNRCLVVRLIAHLVMECYHCKIPFKKSYICQNVRVVLSVFLNVLHIFMIVYSENKTAVFDKRTCHTSGLFVPAWVTQPAT